MQTISSIVVDTIAGSAKAIITHNIRDFKQSDLSFPEILILTPEQLLSR